MVGWFSRAWFLVFKLLLIYRSLSVAVESYRNRDNRANRLSLVVAVDVLIRRDCLVAEANRLTDLRLSTATMNRPASVDVECAVHVKFSTRYVYILSKTKSRRNKCSLHSHLLFACMRSCSGKANDDVRRNKSPASTAASSSCSSSVKVY